jgi:uncharacterized repeat protein (TIGR03803 family)
MRRLSMINPPIRCSTLAPVACIALALCAVMANGSSKQVNFTTLVSFSGSNGSLPESMVLLEASDGNFYGTTVEGGATPTCPSGCGTVFKTTPGGDTVTTLYNFCAEASCADGAGPVGSLVQATNGDFYGVTRGGGSHSEGTVFKITSLGALTTLHSFCAQDNCLDGEDPGGGLVQAASGSFYGTTEFGGTNGGGTVFEITPAGKMTTLYSFCTVTDCGDGSDPISGLVQATNGKLYGETQSGGAVGLGTVFAITTAGKLTTLHSFERVDGAFPEGGLIQATNGNLYGVTGGGGNSNSQCSGGCGTAFKITPGGELTTLHNFCALPSCTDGIGPNGPLVQATDGNLYGTTGAGLGAYIGTVFEIARGGALATLYNFCTLANCADGAFAQAGLLQATDGTFYGTTAGGGVDNQGTIFSLTNGLGPFVSFPFAGGKVGQTGGILGQGFTGTSSVVLNGIPAEFTVVSDTYIRATVPVGATTGYVTLTTPTGELTSNVPFYVIP